MKKLEEYIFPDELKKMSEDELELLSYAIRDFLIQKISRTGGHLASNLGIVELAIAIHTVFDSPQDKIIWDVGHQSYVHKILTGRISGFDTLRKFEGMSGFPKKRESEHDVYDSGHASTSISVGLGMSVGSRLSKKNNRVVSVIGDGALTGGLVYEALNNMKSSKSNMIIVLNDNKMSISENKSGISNYLSRIRISEKYLGTKARVKKSVNRIPLLGGNISTALSDIKDAVKHTFVKDAAVLEAMGIKYLGPVDGHNISELLRVMYYAESLDVPVLIHAVTRKGKGYKPAEMNPDKFHGVGKFDVNTGIGSDDKKTTYSDIFGEKIKQLGEKDDKIVAISAAMTSATGLSEFAEKMPERFFDVGIAEAHAVAFASGLSASGMKPYVAIYSTFLQRAYDQILEDICLQGLPCVFCIDRAGIVGADGETHHGIFDLSYLIQMPGMKILAPCNKETLELMLEKSKDENIPVAIRYPRGAVHTIKLSNGFFYDKNCTVKDGGNIKLLAVGHMLETAFAVSEILSKKGIDISIVYISVVRSGTTSFDIEDYNIEKDDIVFTLEDNIITGGFGAYLASNVDNKVHILAWPDKFIKHGDTASLYKKYGLNPESISERILELSEGEA